MPYKDKEQQRAAARRHYEANKQKMVDRAAAHNKSLRQRAREFVAAYKTGKPCTDCGIVWPPYVSQFDHVNTDKSFNVADYARSGASIAALQVEIAKCELVCANCHAIRTYTRRMAL